MEEFFGADLKGHRRLSKELTNWLLAGFAVHFFLPAVFPAYFGHPCPCRVSWLCRASLSACLQALLALRCLLTTRLFFLP